MTSICYFQIITKKPELAQKFYSQLFGWDIKKVDAPYDYWEFPTERITPKPEMLGAGLTRLDESQTGPLPGLLVYFDVDDVDATLEKVKQLGGSIAVGKMAVPGQGYMAICHDDQKVAFGIWKEDAQAS